MAKAKKKSTSARRGGAKKKAKRTLSKGQVHVMASFNNTIITITDMQGNTVAWGSAGSVGFKGSRKSTPFAARLASEQAGKAAQQLGIQEVDIFIKGPGPGRENAIRAIQAVGIKVRSIADITPIPHNGCRPPKKRRV
ncbi:MAG: 30S ribosomal protein S11 [Anaerolineae bacterium]|jgi:small subunit ribosomal protein S11|nr:30S ribosomal protein S11 [Anaerolineae bacterium]MBT3713497.1 30S ribosomal protein S11 [Anaerolineae bacterium]MBT4312109.1 30S ribosomal protein S11 [Anaerolineae bacterium]MBT4457160.1 30S ribosomal protein S11 [Anaerolineae bacterium]MBT4843083.1 30S ribosomal protein S11 [Anaerolineae bacterium]